MMMTLTPWDEKEQAKKEI
nr:hypothetical protein [Sicyoidochytrium minutum DNA virus]